ncbi:hypothetical protein Tco_0571442 [Tanacetum coccineum]
MEESPKRFTKGDARRQSEIENEQSEESDSEDLNNEIEGENNEDEMRVATKSENEEIIDEKTKRTKKYRKRKEIATTKRKRRGTLKKKRIWNQMSRMEEAIARMKCCLWQRERSENQ